MATDTDRGKFAVIPKEDGLYIEGFVPYSVLAPWAKSMAERLVDRIPVSDLIPVLMKKFMGK